MHFTLQMREDFRLEAFASGVNLRYQKTKSFWFPICWQVPLSYITNSLDGQTSRNNWELSAAKGPQRSLMEKKREQTIIKLQVVHAGQRTGDNASALTSSLPTFEKQQAQHGTEVVGERQTLTTLSWELISGDCMEHVACVGWMLGAAGQTPIKHLRRWREYGV